MNIRLNIVLLCSLLLAVRLSASWGELPFGDYSPFQFASDFEQQTFQQGADAEPLQFFMAMEPGMTPERYARDQRKLDVLLSSLVNNLDRSAKGWKQVRALMNGLDQQIFREYEHIVSLGETLHEGRFNCVSGSAILGLALEKMGVDYQVVATTNHVYLHAKLDGHWYRVEPTAATNKIFRVRDQLASTGRQGLEFLDLKALAGLQYFNQGLVAMDAGNYQQAMSYFLKSGRLYQGKRLDEMQSLCSEKLVLMAESHLAQGNHAEALGLLSLANPGFGEDDFGRKLVLLASLKEVEASTSTEILNLAKMDRLENEFKFLKSFPEWRGTRADYLLLAAARFYRENALDQGRLALMEFEHLLLTDIVVDGNAGGWVYAEAFNSLLRNQQYAEARHVLLSGLSQFPGHKGLLERQVLMSSELAMVQSQN